MLIFEGLLTGAKTAVEQTLDFLAPVKVDDVITACVEVVALLEENRVRLKTSCINQEGVMVLEGEALVIAPNRALAVEAYQSQDENSESQL